MKQLLLVTALLLLFTIPISAQDILNLDLDTLRLEGDTSYTSVEDSLANIPDSSLVRIRIDVENSEIYLDNNRLLQDSFGNRLTPNAWFILNLEVGEYHFYIFNNLLEPLDTTIVLTKDKVESFDLRFISQELASRVFVENPPGIQTVPFKIDSDPGSAVILFNDDTLEVATPAELFVQGGVTRFEVVKEGYQPMVSTIDFEMAKNVSAMFKLRIEEPAPVTPESIGLVYLEKKPMLSTKLADKVRRNYYSLSETFFVFPFCQGLLAKIVVDDSQQESANALLLSGIVLSGGTYLLGRIFSKKKLNYVFAENERRTVNNMLADQTKIDNDKILRDKNLENYRNWTSENSDRGVVIVNVDSLDTNQ